MTGTDEAKANARQKVLFSRHHGEFLVYCNEHPSLHRKNCMDNYVKQHPDAGIVFGKYRLEIKVQGGIPRVEVVDALDFKESFYSNPEQDGISLHKEARERLRKN